MSAHAEVLAPSIAAGALEASSAKIATKPAIGAEGITTVGTAGISRCVNASFVGKAAQTTFKVKHELKTLIPAVTILKEKGTKGTETEPRKIVLIKEVLVLSENEIELVFEVAPEAKEVYWVQIDG